MPTLKKSKSPKDPIIEAYEDFVTLNEKMPFELLEHGDAPYPGHMLLFYLGLQKAVDLAEPAGGLTGFAVYDYQYGKMNLGFELADPEHSAHDDIRDYLDGIEKLSRKVCVMCGEDAGLSARFMPHEWKMPLCKVKDRIHGNPMLDRLIEPDFDLSRIRDDLIRRKKIRVRSVANR